jgi:hypothetical protein
MNQYQYDYAEPCLIEHDLAVQCQERITEVLWDILRNQAKTKYTAIYDAIYERVENDIRYENNNPEYDVE